MSENFSFEKFSHPQTFNFRLLTFYVCHQNKNKHLGQKDRDAFLDQESEEQKQKEANARGTLHSCDHSRANT